MILVPTKLPQMIEIAVDARPGWSKNNMQRHHCRERYLNYSSL